MNMKLASLFLSFFLIVPGKTMIAQTPVPNGDFEIWINHGGYANPQFWDSDNKTANSIPFFGKTVVTQDVDHYSGESSAKLTTKHITFIPINVPGILTLGTLNIDIWGGTYSLTGGFPIHDVPTHLKGFYQYLPNGADSCVIAIGLSRWAYGKRDSLALGYFATTKTVNSWTPFSAWIKYDSAVPPDTFNILIISSAVGSPSEGTILYVDHLTLDYSLGVNESDPATGIEIYQDKGNLELLVFFDFISPQYTFLRLYNLMGEKVGEINPGRIKNERFSFNYRDLPESCYILEIVHDNKKFCRKFLFK